MVAQANVNLPPTNGLASLSGSLSAPSLTQSSAVQFTPSASLVLDGDGDVPGRPVSPASLAMSNSYELSKGDDWREYSRSRQGIRSRHAESRGGGIVGGGLLKGLAVSSPNVRPPAPSNNGGMEGMAFPDLHISGGGGPQPPGVSADDAPAIVISSLAQLQADQDYNYGQGKFKPFGKPLTKKDRARHGMLRTMLRKQLEVTRPNWPKHPNMRSTDRLLDEERSMERELMGGSVGGGGGGGTGMGGSFGRGRTAG